MEPMMKHSLSTGLAIGAAILTLGAIGVKPAHGQMIGRIGAPVPAAADVSQKTDIAADASNGFGYDLYAKLRAGEGDRANLFFSPYSISSALTMTRLGARGNTADEMSATLHLPADPSAIESSFEALSSSLAGDPDKHPFTLTVANALWGQKGEPFLPDYLDVVKKVFDADLVPVDFITQAETSRKQINDWVADKTHDKIKDLLAAGTITADTRLVLTNAIYFKGQWDNQFDAKQTQPGEFNNGKKGKVDYMHQSHEFPYAEDDLCQAVKLPYEGNQVSMLILLPKVLPVDAIREGEDPYHLASAKLEGSLNSQYIDKLLGQLANRKVDLALPKWQATQSFSLGGELADMGMKQAFTPRADFSGINGRTDLFLSDVVHKAFVTVDENGTEAAAATAVMMRTLAIRVESPPATFTADHPFIYLIIDDASRTVLFAGRLYDPSATQ
jgi:serpin B